MSNERPPFEKIPVIDSEIITWTHFNNGVFGGGTHAELELGTISEIEFNPIERFTIRALARYLERGQPVKLLDLGGLYSLSLVAIGKFFDGHSTSGDLRLISTSLENNFTIENALSDAKRRLDNIHEYLELIKIDPNKLSTDKRYQHALALSHSQPILNRGELAFLQENHHRVTYVSGVDTLHLPDIVEKTFGKQSRIDIIHEHYGGLEHHEKKRHAAQAVINSLSPGGLILSHALKAYFLSEDDMLVWDRTRGSLWDLQTDLPVNHRYWAFTLPGSPLKPSDFRDI
jgi:hypothetical protein